MGEKCGCGCGVDGGVPKGVPFAPAEAVEYAAGSIVSKIVIKSEGGSMTLFAFDAGQELSEHSAPFDALVEVIDGEVEVKIGGKPSVLKQGQGIIMPANVPHAVRAVTRFKMALVMIKGG